MTVGTGGLFTSMRPAAAILAVTLLGGAADLTAQIRGARPVGIRVAREKAYLGLELLGGVPTGDFAEFIDGSYGIGGHAVINVDETQSFGIRIDAGLMIYNRDIRSRPLSPTVPFVDVDITTDNALFNMGIGPQFTIGHGPIRPYVYGTAGFTYLFTESSVRGSGNFDSFARSTNFDDATFAAAAGAGLLIRLSRGKTPIFFNMSANFLNNGRAEYLTGDSFQELPSGGLLISPVESGTNLVVFRAGVSFGLR